MPKKKGKEKATPPPPSHYSTPVALSELTPEEAESAEFAYKIFLKSLTKTTFAKLRAILVPFEDYEVTIDPQLNAEEGPRCIVISIQINKHPYKSEKDFFNFLNKKKKKIEDFLKTEKSRFGQTEIYHHLSKTDQKLSRLFSTYELETKFEVVKPEAKKVEAQNFIRDMKSWVEELKLAYPPRVVDYLEQLEAEVLAGRDLDIRNYDRFCEIVGDDFLARRIGALIPPTTSRSITHIASSFFNDLNTLREELKIIIKQVRSLPLSDFVGQTDVETIYEVLDDLCKLSHIEMTEEPEIAHDYFDPTLLIDKMSRTEANFANFFEHTKRLASLWQAIEEISEDYISFLVIAEKYSRLLVNDVTSFREIQPSAQDNYKYLKNIMGRLKPYISSTLPVLRTQLEKYIETQEREKLKARKEREEEEKRKRTERKILTDKIMEELLTEQKEVKKHRVFSYVPLFLDTTRGRVKKAATIKTSADEIESTQELTPKTVPPKQLLCELRIGDEKHILDFSQCDSPDSGLFKMRGTHNIYIATCGAPEELVDFMRADSMQLLGKGRLGETGFKGFLTRNSISFRKSGHGDTRWLFYRHDLPDGTVLFVYGHEISHKEYDRALDHPAKSLRGPLARHPHNIEARLLEEKPIDDEDDTPGPASPR